jgi:hypothetical protein
VSVNEKEVASDACACAAEARRASGPPQPLAHCDMKVPGQLLPFCWAGCCIKAPLRSSVLGRAGCSSCWAGLGCCCEQQHFACKSTNNIPAEQRSNKMSARQRRGGSTPAPVQAYDTLLLALPPTCDLPPRDTIK